MMSRGQDEPSHTYTQQHTGNFKRRTCYGGRVGAKIQKLNSSLCMEIETNLQNQ